MAEIAEGTVLHDDLHLLFLLVEVVVIDLQQVGVGELFHEFDLLHGLLDLEGVDFDLLEREGLGGFVMGQVDAAEGALADYLGGLVGLHWGLMDRYDYMLIARSRKLESERIEGKSTALSLLDYYHLHQFIPINSVIFFVSVTSSNPFSS